MIDDVYKGNKAFLEEEMDNMKVKISNNLFKLFVVAANKSVGLGAKRIERVLVELNKRVSEVNTENKADWWHKFDEECKHVLGSDTYYKYFKDAEFKRRDV